MVKSHMLAMWKRRSRDLKNRHLRPILYSLSLALYCGSWTYFTAVGATARYGWNFFTNYLGAILAITLFFPVMLRIASIVKQENIVSIADFLSSRYGKNRIVGTLVATLALLTSLPFLAMQLRGMAVTWATVTHTDHSHFVVLACAAILAGFTILVGARRPTLTEHNRELVQIVALESIFKFAVLLAVALLGIAVIASVSSANDWTKNLGSLGEPLRFDGGFFNATLIALAALFCTPRLFYIGYVELEKLDDLKTARWLFPAYVAGIGLMVVPIVIAGTMVFQGQGAGDYLFELPRQYGGQFLTALVFLGAFFSLATMVVVETIALSAMISNELVLPFLARARWHANRNINIGRVIVNVRRGSICALLLLSWLYYFGMKSDVPLGSMGSVSSAGIFQFMPVLIGGLYWRRGHAAGAIAGLCGGFAVWFYAIAAPQFLDNFGVVYDLGFRLAAASGTDQFVQKMLLSLVVNTALYVGVSIAARPRLIDRIQASAFIDAQVQDESARRSPELRGTVGDLKALITQFLGHEDAAGAFKELEKAGNRRLKDKDRIDPGLARAAERLIAGAIGASLARRVIGWQLAEGHWETADVLRALDDAAQAVQFNRELLQATVDHMSQGVYVVDRDGLLIAWNTRYVELFAFPSGFIHVGKPIAETIGFALSTSGVSDSEITSYVNMRLTQIRQRVPHSFERIRPDGTVLKILGMPMPGGRYVTSFTDVTEMRRVASELQQANERLEARVLERTRELTAANMALAEAKGRAERTTNSQAHFLAAASHDLLQPLHAARLFMGALREDLPPKGSSAHELANNADLSIESANRLLRALLNLSRLEVGGVKPEVRPVNVGALLSELRREFEAVAADRNLTLRVTPSNVWVLSDPDLLRSVLQNLIGNAIRYTKTGAVLVGCRRDPDGVRFEVRDSGPGIPDDALALIFEEFSRLANSVETGPGAGLGLAIAERICNLLNHKLTVRSAVGKGSTFSVTVTQCERNFRRVGRAGTRRIARRTSRTMRGK